MAKRKKTPIRVSAGDALSFNPVGKKGKKKGVNKFFAGGLIFIVLLVGMGTIWLFAGNEIQRFLGFKPRQIPVVYASLDPIKVRPENPGGLQVPNRDKLVYGRIEGGEGEAEGLVERLLPPPEIPLSLPKSPPVTSLVAPTVASGNNETMPLATLSAESLDLDPLAPRQLVPGGTEANGPEKLITSIDDSAKIPSDTPPEIPELPLAPASSASPEVIESVTSSTNIASISIPPQKPEIKQVTPLSASTSAAGNAQIGVYQLQLAATRSSEGTKQEWKRLRKKHADILGNLSLTIMRANLGETKGIYYRLRVGSYATKEEAQSICDQLINRKTTCLPAKTGK